MKILTLNGSPSKNSNTLTITTEFLRGLNYNNDHQITTINVMEKKINYCTGCLSCWIRQDGHCVIKDDMNDLLDEISTSDMIIWSFPLYEYGVPAPLKTLIDRTNPFLKMQMKTEGNRVVHETVMDISKKKNLILVGCGFPYFEDNFTPLKMQMKNIFKNPDMLCIFESGLVTINDPKLQPIKEKLFSSLNKAGREYNDLGKISESTVKQIEKPMLPNDIYINMINQLVK